MRRRPMVILALIWIAGYSLAQFGVGVLQVILLAGGLGLGIYLIDGRRLSAFWIVILLTLPGAYVYHSYMETYSSSIPYPGNPGVEAAIVEGVIDSPVEVDGDRALMYVRVVKWQWDGEPEVKLNKEKVYVTVRLLEQDETELAGSWARGDWLQITGKAVRPEPARNFGGFDFRSFLQRQKVSWMITAKGASNIVRLEGRKQGKLRRLMSWNDDIRAQAGSRLEQLYPAGEAGYMKGLLLGVREDLDPDRFRAFSKLGLTHVLAISGLHVGVFCGFIAVITRRLKWTKEGTQTLLLWCIPLYVLLTGSSPSVVRAGLTAMAGIITSKLGLLKDGLSLLGAAAVGILLVQPSLLLNVGFQLSFVVTAGLLIGVPIISRLLPISRKWLQSSLAVAITAQLVSFPLSIYYFNQLSLLSLLANLLLVPLISLFTIPAGYVSLLLSYLFPYGGELAADITSSINQGIFWMVEKGSRARFSQLIWPSPPLWWMGAYFVLLGIILAVLKRRNELDRLEGSGIRLLLLGAQKIRQLGIAAVVLLCLMALLLTEGYTPGFFSGEKDGQVSILDVGQGDSILIRTPGRRFVLLDGGGTIGFIKPGEEWKLRKDPYEVGRKTVVPLLKKRGVHKLDYIVISHLDTDHIGGLAAVVEEIPVGAILYNGTYKSGPAVERLFRLALRYKVPLLQGKEGDRVKLDSWTRLTILSPPANQFSQGEIVEEQNPATLVTLLEMYGRSFLFTGDIGFVEEEGLVSRLSTSTAGLLDNIKREAEEGMSVDVLKVAHHGSKSSTSSAWLEWCKPHISVISAGKNNLYGHPNGDTLNRLEEVGSQIYRTDQQGEIQFRVRKNSLEVRSKL